MYDGPNPIHRQRTRCRNRAGFPWGRTVRRRIMEDMAQVHMTEAELARDLHAVLEKVRQGAEVIVERNSTPVALIKAPAVTGRKISEVIAALEVSGANARVDEDFTGDVEEAMKLTREPWNPPSWE